MQAQTMESNDMDQNEDLTQICAFCRNSNYDLLQPHTGKSWGAAWTFVGNDLLAAERAGRQMRRMGVNRVRHACRARFKGDGDEQDVVLVTELPDWTQHIVRLADGVQVEQVRILADESLRALATAIIT
jgi:hypothetical protein